MALDCNPQHGMLHALADGTASFDDEEVISKEAEAVRLLGDQEPDRLSVANVGLEDTLRQLVLNFRYKLIALLLTGLLAVAAICASLLSSAPHEATHPQSALDDPLPPCDDVTNNTCDVQWLLDFAMIGHSKCATTSQLKWLREHPEILMHEHEVSSLNSGRPAEFVSRMLELPGGAAKRGYKSPRDVTSPVALQLLQAHWPHTKLIVGVRHPVWWFESYVNYAARRFDDHHRKQDPFFNLPPANAVMLGLVPTHLASFHVHLSFLGKTPMVDADELGLLVDHRYGPLATNASDAGDTDDAKLQPTSSLHMENPVFLYEVSQPFDSRDDRDVQYRSDLQDFLGLTTALPPIPTRTTQSPNYKYAIDICDAQFRSVRGELVDTGRAAAAWIEKFFLKHPSVRVSSSAHFVEVLRSWSTDPCQSSDRDNPSLRF